MKEVTYTGPECILGRFGRVKPGQVLLLDNHEYESVKDDRHFRKKAEQLKPGLVFPGPTPHFDLRSIPWKEERLPQDLDKRSKDTIMKIGNAMKALGVKVQIAHRLNKRVMVDAIIEAATAMGWTKKEGDQNE